MYNEEPSSSLSVVRVVGISVIVSTVVILFVAVAMSVLCCVKHCRKNIPNDGDLRCEQSNNAGMHQSEDNNYPDVIASMKLKDNQAYGHGNLNSTHSSKDTTDDTFISPSSTFELKGNEAYAALDLLS